MGQSSTVHDDDAGRDYHSAMATLSVRVTPRASRDAVKGFLPGGKLHVTVTAPPADGAANRAVTQLVAKALRLPPRDVVLMRGAGSREKVFEVPLTPDEVSRRIPGGGA